MNKRIITVSAISTEEAKKIREEFKNSEYAKDYILNIHVSGNEDIKQNLGKFLSARLNRA